MKLLISRRFLPLFACQFFAAFNDNFLKTALIFLILIHKLEYFLNAKIVGHRIHARAWEILLAMLVMEAAFGLPGVVAAPIYYAYLKGELTAARLL